MQKCYLHKYAEMLLTPVLVHRTSGWEKNVSVLKMHIRCRYIQIGMLFDFLLKIDLYRLVAVAIFDYL